MSPVTPALRTRRRVAAPMFAVATVLLGVSMLAQPAVAADAPVGLGTATSFAVLAGAGITNTNATTITGDVGTFPTTTRSGFASVTLVGTDHGGDAVTQGAKDDLVTAYDDAAGRTPATPHVVELGGKTLSPGVYSGGTFGITGTLTLDGGGDSNAQFVFQVESTLITEVRSRVLLVNGASPCRVVWQVGSSATFKTGTDFVGDVLALTDITAQSGADFVGRLLARNGAVTLDNNTISNAACTAGSGPGATVSPTASPTASPNPTTTTPAPVVATSPAPAATRAGQSGAVGGAASSAAGVPVAPRARSGGVAREAGTQPLLPETGSRATLAFAGFALLAGGALLVVAGDTAGYPKGTHRR